MEEWEGKGEDGRDEREGEGWGGRRSGSFAREGGLYNDLKAIYGFLLGEERESEPVHVRGE